MQPGFSCRDLVAVLIKYDEDGEQRLVVCSANLPYDSEDPPRQRNLNSCDIVKIKTSI
jgi:hypothetical protein